MKNNKDLGYRNALQKFYLHFRGRYLYIRLFEGLGNTGDVMQKFIVVSILTFTSPVIIHKHIHIQNNIHLHTLGQLFLPTSVRSLPAFLGN